MDSDDLRDALLAAAERDDHEALARLCGEAPAAIASAFADWKAVPPGLRDDVAATERYVAALVVVARHFADMRGDPSLLQILMGDGSDPIASWHEQLQGARDLIARHAYAQAEQRLSATLADMGAHHGSAIELYRPVALGLIGSARFNAGRVPPAIEAISEALALCHDAGDDEGAAAYAASLYEIERWRGDGAAAAMHANAAAERLLEIDPPQARHMQTRAAIAAAGEPLLRVVVVTGDQTFELDELSGEIGIEDPALQFAFERNRVTLGAAVAEMDEARTAFGSDHGDDGLAALRAAITLDPHAPDPHARTGWALLRAGHAAAARAAFARADALAPRWHHVREDLWLASRVADGSIDGAVVSSVAELEDGERPARARIDLAERALERAPDYGRLWFLLGQARLECSDLENALENFAEALERAETEGLGTRARVQLGALEPDVVRSKRLLLEAVELGGDLVATAMARVMLAAARRIAN